MHYLLLIYCLYFFFVGLETYVRSETLTRSVVSLCYDHLGALHLISLNKSKSDRLEIRKLDVLTLMEVSCQKILNNCCKISFKSPRKDLFVTLHNFKKICFVQEIESKTSLLYGEMPGCCTYAAVCTL